MIDGGDNFVNADWKCVSGIIHLVYSGSLYRCSDLTYLTQRTNYIDALMHLPLILCYTCKPVPVVC